MRVQISALLVSVGVLFLTGCATPNVSNVPLPYTGKTVATFVVRDVAAKLSPLSPGERLTIQVEPVGYLLKDLESWCDLSGNRMVFCEVADGFATVVLEKGGGSAVAEKRLAIILSSDDLLELLSPLGFALAAQLSGMQVSIYFQGDAVKVLRKGFRAQAKAAVLFSRTIEDGLNGIGHIPPQDKIRELVELGARLYVCGPSLDNAKIPLAELCTDELVVCEYFTFLIAMKDATMHMYQ